MKTEITNFYLCSRHIHVFASEIVANVIEKILVFLVSQLYHSTIY